MKNRNAVSVEPIGNLVVIRQDQASETTSGGIVLPDAAQDPRRFGTVLAVGPGQFRTIPAYTKDEQDSMRYPMQCQVGDRVILPLGGGDAVRLDPADEQSEVLVISESHLCGILRSQ